MQVLEAMAWEGNGDIGKVIDFVKDRDAFIEHRCIGIDGRDYHYVSFDENKVRNTHVHGEGFKAGFIVCILNEKRVL